MTKLTRGFTFLFQPALPMRGVTAGDDGRCVTGHISTRTPHAGSDQASAGVGVELVEFQPALPMRGVTNPLLRTFCIPIISTRTPHAGSDS